jgi:hypothetical protein
MQQQQRLAVLVEQDRQIQLQAHQQLILVAVVAHQTVAQQAQAVQAAAVRAVRLAQDRQVQQTLVAVAVALPLAAQAVQVA